MGQTEVFNYLRNFDKWCENKEISAAVGISANKVSISTRKLCKSGFVRRKLKENASPARTYLYKVNEHV